MGRSLGVNWAQAGHDVLFGARDPGKATAAADLAGKNGSSGSNDEAASFGDLLIWNPRVSDPASVLNSPAILDNKIVVDMHNGPVPADLKFPPIEMSFSSRLAAALPRTRIVKAFNTIAQELLEQDADVIRRAGIAIFLAGDDEAAKDVVAGLAGELGFTPVDCGPLHTALQLETMGDLVRLLMIGHGQSLFTSFALRETAAAKGVRLGGRQPSNLP
jgi:predicted dinucleotide-binding enzyme